jgi:hypothetical protein
MMILARCVVHPEGVAHHGDELGWSRKRAEDHALGSSSRLRESTVETPTKGTAAQLSRCPSRPSHRGIDRPDLRPGQPPAPQGSVCQACAGSVPRSLSPSLCHKGCSNREHSSAIPPHRSRSPGSFRNHLSSRLRQPLDAALERCDEPTLPVAR